MRTSLFAYGRDYSDTIILLEELGFNCKENSSNTSAMCLNYDKRIAFRVNQLKDSDKDFVPDGIDCDPFNPMVQDVLAPQVGDIKHTLYGYRLDDYYYSNGKWHVRPGAKPVFKKPFSFLRRKKYG